MRAGGGHAAAVPLQGLQGQCDTGILAGPGHCLLQDTAWIFLLAKRIRPSNTELGREQAGNQPQGREGRQNRGSTALPGVATQAKELGSLGTHFLRLAQG